MYHKIVKVKQHIRENKKVYIAAAGGVVVGGMLVKLRVVPATAPIINTIAPVFHNNNSSSVNLGGYARKIIRCIETNDMWPTSKAAADSANATAAVMSKHLNGHTEHIDGLHYVIEGLGTTG